jgi:hypothetical protein
MIPGLPERIHKPPRHSREQQNSQQNHPAFSRGRLSHQALLCFYPGGFRVGETNSADTVRHRGLPIARVGRQGARIAVAWIGKVIIHHKPKPADGNWSFKPRSISFELANSLQIKPSARQPFRAHDQSKASCASMPCPAATSSRGHHTQRPPCGETQTYPVRFPRNSLRRALPFFQAAPCILQGTRLFQNVAIMMATIFGRFVGGKRLTSKQAACNLSPL